VFSNPLVISTIKPRDMAVAMSVSSAPLKKLEYRTVNLFYFLIKGKTPYNTWLFYPEKSIVFNRTSINFHPRAVGDGRFIICVEITKKKKDIQEIKRTDLEKELFKIYGIKEDDIIDMWNDFINGAYPIYHIGFKSDIESVLNMIESHGDVYCLGRHACHNYNNMDHTIVEATDLANIIVHKGGIEEWAKQRRRYNWKIVD
jgi:protoporphyrinogen oxidase